MLDHVLKVTLLFLLLQEIHKMKKKPNNPNVFAGFCELGIIIMLFVFREQVESLCPCPGWVELDPEVLWSQFTGVIKEAVQGKGLNFEKLFIYQNK